MKNPLKKLTNPESFVLHRRIGSTHFTVNVHFNEESTETLKDKALRLMKSEAETADFTGNVLSFMPKHSKIEPLQAAGVLGGSL